MSDSYGRIYIHGGSLPQGVYSITVLFSGNDDVWADTVSECTLTVHLVRTSLQFLWFKIKMNLLYS